MTVFHHFLNHRVGKGPIDSFLTRWGLCGGGLVVFSVAAGTLRKVARDQAETVFGVEAALVLLLVMVLLGILGGRFHDAASTGELRTRLGAYLSYPASLALLLIGGWQIWSLSAGEARMILGLLLLGATCTAILCLGVAADLVRSARV